MKHLAKYALGVEDAIMFGDVDIPSKAKPFEIGYAPFAKAAFIDDGKIIYPNKDKWYGKWPDFGKIKIHIDHWQHNPTARKYARDDVKYTRDLYKHFGSPDCGDVDSLLACMVGAVRWRGFAINIDGINNLKNKKQKWLNDFKEQTDTKYGFNVNFNSTETVKKYIKEVMDDTEKIIIEKSSKRVILEQISKWRVSTVCNDCNGSGCDKCSGGLIATNELHPAAERAINILTYRYAKKEIETFNKLICAGRFHADFNVTGALSNRMSGTSGLNAQGIKNTKEVRTQFPLADNGLQLDGGDFGGFEVSIADAVYNDPVMHEELLSGKSFHGLLGAKFFDKTYEEICATKGLEGDKDLYGRSKSGTFALLYMGEAYTLANRVGIPEEQAQRGYDMFIKRYKVLGEKRKKYVKMFCSMTQPDGIGTRVIWKDPCDYIESLTGFRRHFNIENMITKVLFDLAEDPPKSWLSLKIKVIRRDRQQTVCGALRSALFAAAFALMSANVRAAGNHVIQSTGAEINKNLQSKIWELQPIGIHEWIVQPLNVHDEVMAPVKPEFSDKLKNLTEEFVKSNLGLIPLLKIEWSQNLDSWAGK